MNDYQLPAMRARRVQLRPLSEGDLPQLVAIFGDPSVARFIGIPQIRDETDARALLADIRSTVEARTLFQWGVEALDVALVVGTCSLASIDWTNERAEIGFALATAHQRKGLMTEALRVLLNHAFSDLRLHRLEADVDPRNERSLRVLEKLGFVREGYARERHLVNGERQDSVLLGMLAQAERLK